MLEYGCVSHILTYSHSHLLIFTISHSPITYLIYGEGTYIPTCPSPGPEMLLYLLCVLYIRIILYYAKEYYTILYYIDFFSDYISHISFIYGGASGGMIPYTPKLCFKFLMPTIPYHTISYIPYIHMGQTHMYLCYAWYGMVCIKGLRPHTQKHETQSHKPLNTPNTIPQTLNPTTPQPHKHN